MNGVVWRLSLRSIPLCMIHGLCNEATPVPRIPPLRVSAELLRLTSSVHGAQCDDEAQKSAEYQQVPQCHYDTTTIATAAHRPVKYSINDPLLHERGNDEVVIKINNHLICEEQLKL